MKNDLTLDEHRRKRDRRRVAGAVQFEADALSALAVAMLRTDLPLSTAYVRVRAIRERLVAVEKTIAELAARK